MCFCGQVRWADIEEKRTQEKMRAIGFVVGQTDWKRMMDPNAGNRALNKTKYIERVNKRRQPGNRTCEHLYIITVKVINHFAYYAKLV